MIIASFPPDEANRLVALHALGLLDTPRDASFDRLVQLAKELTGQPAAALSLVAERRQWFKASSGLAVPETSRDVAFCAHTILGDQLTVIDTHADPRFFDNPLVLEAPYIRSYFGRTVRAPNGAAIAALCAFGPEPLVPSDKGLRGLAELAALAEALIARQAARGG